jgi:hypothetical protein
MHVMSMHVLYTMQHATSHHYNVYVVRMGKPKVLKDIVISHFLEGKKAPEISELLSNKVHRSTVNRWILDYSNPKRVAQKRPVGRPRSVRTKKLIYKVKNRLNSTVMRKSSRNMAKDFGTCQDTILKVLHDDLGVKPYRKIRVPKLTEKHINERLTISRWIRKHIKKAKTKKMMWVDEKVFTSNGYFNPQNDITWALSREEATELGATIEEEKYPEAVMIGMGITWNGLTEPFIFEEDGFRLNTKKYLPVLEFYKNEGDRLFGHNNWGFAQDGASCHTSNPTQEWCQNHFKWFIDKSHWPGNTPEWNPMDYSVWAEIERHLDYKKVKTRNNLITEIKKATKKVDAIFCREVIGQFLRRIYSTEKHNGNIICNDFR